MLQSVVCRRVPCHCLVRGLLCLANPMTDNIRKLIDAEPFVPFTIHTADGSVLRVPTVDHVAVTPGAKRVFVFGDDGSYEVLSPLLSARISVESGDPVTSTDV